ncbi:MAG TPA: hypothetical protein VK817_07315 [Trebonia sp.]|nr:hypothetical protein [Trebonia sp.]
MRRLNHPVAAGIISLVLWLGFVLARWQVWAQGHISLFIMSGMKDYSHPSQMVPPISHVPSQGYDGQFYYRFARNPFNWNPTAYGITIDHNYRYTRIGYSLIAWILSGGGHARLLPTVLVVINLICVGLMAYLGAKLAQESGRHALWGLAFVVYVGLVISVGRNTSEPLADACMLAGILAYRHRRYVWAALLIAYAVFTNEPILVLAVSFAVVRLYQMWKKRVKPGLPDLVWVLPGAVYVLLQLAEKVVVKGKSGGVSDFTSNLTLPFKALVPGVVRDIVDSSASHLGLYDYNLLDFIALAVIVVAGLLVIRAARVSLEEKGAFVGFVLIEIVLASGQFWDSTFGEGRTYIDAFLLAILMLLATPAGTVTASVAGAAEAVSGAGAAVGGAVSDAAGAVGGAVSDAAVKARTTLAGRTLLVLGKVFSADWVMTNKRLGWLMVVPVIVLVLVARRHILHQ